MTATQILSEIISILVGGITGIAEGIGNGLATLAKACFLEVSEAGAVTGLNTFGMLICIFAGISLAVGLSRKIVGWVSSLGARN